LLALVDLVFAHFFTKARWFILHALANSVVVFFAWDDTKKCAMDPINAMQGGYSLLPMEMVRCNLPAIIPIIKLTLSLSLSLSLSL
jgi:hypothetical protein